MLYVARDQPSLPDHSDRPDRLLVLKDEGPDAKSMGCAGVGYVVGLALFWAVAKALKPVLGPTSSESPVLSQLVLKTVLVLVALLAWKLLGRPFSEMGWRRADWWNRSYLPWFALAAVAMMTGSVVAILLDVRHPVASKMSFLQLVLLGWILSSFSEEVFVSRAGSVLDW